MPKVSRWLPPDWVPLVELPPKSRREDVVGGIHELLVVYEHLHIRHGDLAQADRNMLYIG